MFFVDVAKTYRDEQTGISRSTIRGKGGMRLNAQRLIVSVVSFALTSDRRRCSGHGVGPDRVHGSPVDDRGRGPRPLRSAERHVVVAVRERRPAEVRDHHDHVLSECHVGGGGLRPDADCGHGVSQYFGQREIRYVPATVTYGRPNPAHFENRDQSGLSVYTSLVRYV